MDRQISETVRIKKESAKEEFPRRLKEFLEALENTPESEIKEITMELRCYTTPPQ